jgi:PHD-finger
VCNFLKEGWKEKFMVCGMLKSAQQVDGISCGAYIMYSITLISFGKYTTMWQNFTPEMVVPLRCFVFNCIVQNEFHVLAHECTTCKHWYNRKSCGMVACDICDVWTHIKCTSMSLSEAKIKDYICNHCEEVVKKWAFNNSKV